MVSSQVARFPVFLQPPGIGEDGPSREQRGAARSSAEQRGAARSNAEQRGAGSRELPPRTLEFKIEAKPSENQEVGPKLLNFTLNFDGFQSGG